MIPSRKRLPVLLLVRCVVRAARRVRHVMTASCSILMAVAAPPLVAQEVGGTVVVRVVARNAPLEGAVVRSGRRGVRSGPSGIARLVLAP